MVILLASTKRSRQESVIMLAREKKKSTMCILINELFPKNQHRYYNVKKCVCVCVFEGKKERLRENERSEIETGAAIVT